MKSMLARRTKIHWEMWSAWNVAEAMMRTTCFFVMVCAHLCIRSSSHLVHELLAVMFSHANLLADNTHTPDKNGGQESLLLFGTHDLIKQGQPCHFQGHFRACHSENRSLNCASKCAGCERACHASCANLNALPEGDWFCWVCQQHRHVDSEGNSTAATTAEATSTSGKRYCRMILCGTSCLD